VSASRRFRITVAVVAACCLLPLAYSVFRVATHRPSRSAPPASAPAPASTSAVNGPPVTDMALQVTPAPYQLPAGAGEIWVFGGQTPSGATSAIQRISPATGQATVAGHLPVPLPGSAAIVLDGQVYVAGGAAAGATSQMVDRFDPATSSVRAAGQLPVPVTYAAGVVAGGVGYLIGGEDGPGRYLTADYSDPGRIVEFTSAGHL
jgi:hypothetical protein